MIHTFPAPQPIAIKTDNCIAREDSPNGKEIRLDVGSEFLHVASAGGEHAYLVDPHRKDGAYLLVPTSAIESIARISTTQSVAT